MVISMRRTSACTMIGWRSSPAPRRRPARGPAGGRGRRPGVLVGGLGAADALDADRQALVVHHGEHGGEAAVRLADQVADGAVEVHHAGGRGLDAHLVLDGAAVHRVARAEAAVGLDQELGHQEQRDAARAGRRVGQARQHQVDDVGGEVLLAAGDEDLGAGEGVAAVGARFGAGAQQAQVAARVRLGQAHGAGPFAAVQARQVGALELLAGVGVDRQAGPGGQRRVQGEAGVGAVEHLLELHGEHLGHAQAAVGGVAGQTHPAAVDVGGVGLLEAGRGAHRAGLELRAFLVAAAAERGDQLAGDLGGFFEDGVGGVGIHRLAERRQARPQARGVEDFVEHKAHVAQGGVEFGHSGPLWTSRRQAPYSGSGTKDPVFRTRPAGRLTRPPPAGAARGYSVSAPGAGCLPRTEAKRSRWVRSTRIYSTAPVARPQPAP